MTNEYKAGKLSIIKCDQCRDGYLIVKSARGSFRLGCTNYKKDGTGCGRVMKPESYYELMGITDKIPVAPVYVPKGKDIKPRTISKDRVQESASDRPRTIIQSAGIPDIIYGEWELDQLLKEILQCLADISSKRFYSADVLTDVLLGIENKYTKDGHLEQTKAFGKLQDMSKDDLDFIVSWLISNGFILKTKERYPVLHPTYNGTHYGEAIKKRQLLALKKLLEENSEL
jgi:DNA helicase-4